VVYAWGNNASGQLGSTTPSCGTAPCSTTPIQVSGLSSITAIAEGYNFSLALTSNGTVYAWGDNTYGTLGNGSTTNSMTPVPVAQIANVTAIAAGEFGLALTNSGTVYAWGDNLYGEVGAGSSQTCGAGYSCSTTPLQMSGLPAGVTAIATGGEYGLALAGDSTVWSWGDDAIGQLGNGSSDPTPHPTPAQITGLTGVGAIAAGGNHALKL
jgi:alpha-tubulin suppressor-like RCC1 family protein